MVAAGVRPVLATADSNTRPAAVGAVRWVLVLAALLQVDAAVGLCRSNAAASLDRAEKKVILCREDNDQVDVLLASLVSLYGSVAVRCLFPRCDSCAADQRSAAALSPVLAFARQLNGGAATSSGARMRRSGASTAPGAGEAFLRNFSATGGLYLWVFALERPSSTVLVLLGHICQGNGAAALLWDDNNDAGASSCRLQFRGLSSCRS